MKKSENENLEQTRQDYRAKIMQLDLTMLRTVMSGLVLGAEGVLGLPDPTDSECGCWDCLGDRLHKLVNHIEFKCMAEAQKYFDEISENGAASVACAEWLEETEKRLCDRQRPIYALHLTMWAQGNPLRRVACALMALRAESFLAQSLWGACCMIERATGPHGAERCTNGAKKQARKAGQHE